ncbi:hypothetical protein RV18_GL001282 [Enterococcus termitis]|nr:hypothetical protein RV18_GL001282 [Enterococcus termitis]
MIELFEKEVSNLTKQSKRWLAIGAVCGLFFLLGVHFFSVQHVEPAKMPKVVQSATKEDRANIDLLIDKAHVKGTVLLIDQGTIFYEKSYGYADQKHQKKNRNESIYPIASLQKIITGAVVLELVKDGILTLDMTLDKFYPEIERSGQITINDLLSHTSGIDLPEEEPEYLLKDQKSQINYALKELTVNQNKEFLYTNGNYTLLAGIISASLKQPYEEVIQERVIDKLALKHTYFWDHLPESESLPVPYIHTTQDYQPDSFPSSKKLFSSLLGAGNMYMSVEDFWLFTQSLVNGQLYTQNEYEELAQVKKEGYRSGMIYFDNLNYSEGSLGGYNTVIYGDQDKQRMVILFANQSGEYGMRELSQQLYQLLPAEE